MTVNLDTEPVVLTLTASEDDDTPQWDVYIDAASAPAGEYLVFGSTTPPTSDSALEGFDFTSCRTPAGVPRDCVVPGLGTFWGRTVLEADGKLTLWGSAGYGTVGTPYYAVIARRGVDAKSQAPTPLSAKVVLGVNGTGCTPNPDPPVVSTGVL